MPRWMDWTIDGAIPIDTDIAACYVSVDRPHDGLMVVAWLVHATINAQTKEHRRTAQEMWQFLKDEATNPAIFRWD